MPDRTLHRLLATACALLAVIAVELVMLLIPRAEAAEGDSRVVIVGVEIDPVTQAERYKAYETLLPAGEDAAGRPRFTRGGPQPFLDVRGTK